MRNGTFPLNIELGRYRGLPVQERICRSCDLDKVEDEYHFLCECVKYETERRELYRKINLDIHTGLDIESFSRQEKLLVLLSSPVTAARVADYIGVIHKMRS